MGLSHRTQLVVTAKGIVTPDDLSEFTKEGLETVFQNLRKPPKMLVQPIPAIVNHPGILTEVEPYVVSAKSKMQLLVALKISKYYEMTSRTMTPANMSWIVLKNFEEQWNALMEKKDATTLLVPKLTEGLTAPKWLDYFKMHCKNIIGARGVPIFYVMRSKVMVAMPPPPLVIDQLYSEQHGSLEDELIARASHTHALYKSDNQDVHQLVERAIRDSGAYAATIAPFARTKNGRDAAMAMESQHAGKDVWDDNIKNAEDFLQNRKWSGTTTIPFLHHAAQHRKSFTELQEAQCYVAVEVPNQRSRVKYLIDSITSIDPSILAGLATQ